MPENIKTKKQAFYQLQADTCELIPQDAVIQAIKAGKVNDITRAQNTVAGLTKDLTLLIAIIDATVPVSVYTVPDNIRRFA